MWSLALAAGLAASASAFLVVPEVTKVEVESIPADVRDRLVQTVDVECPGCPVSMPHGGEFTTQMDSHLQMKFEIDLEDASRLLVNGFEIYPHADPFSKSLKAPHIVDVPNKDGMMRGGMMHSGSNNMMNSVDTLGFTLLSKTLPTSGDDNDNLQHVTIDLQVVEVSNVFVNSIPSIHINLVEDDAGMLAIHQIDTSTPEGVATTATDGKEKPKCDFWLCNWIESLESHWNHWRPHCGIGAKNRPHHQGHQGHHGHRPSHNPETSPVGSVQGSQRTWGQLFRSITTHILLPILVGVMAGVVMSTLGMIVGSFIVIIYRRLRRSSCPRHNVLTVAVPIEEKDGLMEHQEPPPSYEEAPVREENADAKV